MNLCFDGLGKDMGNLSRLSNAETRSISAENFTGAKANGGMATEGTGSVPSRELGRTWKVSPSINIAGKATATLADIDGPGAIQVAHLVMASPTDWRRLMLRFYWGDEETPSVETPVGDFFCNGWTQRCNISSLAICVNPAGAFNSYWGMPFREHARITVENLGDEEVHGFYYQVTYVLTDVPDDRAYFHAQWRRSNPLPYKQDHILVGGVTGQGHYVGTYLAWGVRNNGWWGEGEIKFFMDGDKEWPTICGTGTEDYFGGAWSFEFPKGQYGVFTSPYSGLAQVIKTDGLYASQQRFGLYRGHIADPIRFKQDLRVTIQALGWRDWPPNFEKGPRYLPLQDDIASTV